MADRTGVNINWGGLDTVLERAARNVSNTQRLMMQIGALMKASTKGRFDSGTNPEGETWTPSKKSSGKTLVGEGKRGGLQGSISFSATPFEVHVGSSLPYARIHQLGGQAGRGHGVTLPARPYLGASREDAEEIQALIAAYMEETLT